MSYDLIAIGESLRDVFYLLDEASISCSINKDRCLLCLEYAEKIPVREVVKVPAAGNSSNVAVGAARLGLNVALVTWVGKDHAGRHVQEALKEENVDQRYVIIDPKFPTSEATILNFEGERTQLVYFQPREYRMPRLARTRCIYYSAMGSTHAHFDRDILKEIDRQPGTFFAFQPGTTHIRRGFKALLPLLKRSELFILNKDEAHLLLGDGERTVCNLLEHFYTKGAKNVVITDGKNGADAFDGKQHWHMPIFNGQAKERTGAGDSFACGVTVALLKGLDLPTALRWGTANSWSVVADIGPQKGLLHTGAMARILKKFSSTKPTIHKHI